MQAPAQPISGSLGNWGPQPVNLLAGILVTLVQQQADLMKMLRPLAEFYEMELAKREQEANSGGPT